MSGVIAAVSTVIAAGGIYMGEKAQRQQARAQRQNLEQARKAEKAQEEAINRANMRQPDIAAIISSAQAAQREGIGSTMLTGTKGIDPSALVLGRKTLLGA